MAFVAIISLVTTCWAQALGTGVPSICFAGGHSCIAGQQASSLLQKQSLSKSSAVDLTEETLKGASTETHGLETSCSSDAVIARDAPLDEDGFQQVAASCCHQDMKEFVRRTIYDMGLKVCDEGGLSGFVPFYSCPVTTLTFAGLEAELRDAPTSTCRWLALSGTECTPPAAECAVIISRPAPAPEPAVTGFFALAASNPLELVRNTGVVDTVKSELAGALGISSENINVVIATSTLGLTLLQGNPVFTSLITGTAWAPEPNCTVYAVFSVQDTSASFLQQMRKQPIDVAQLLSILRSFNWPDFFVRLVAALLRVAPRANGLEVTDRSYCVQGSTCERDAIKPAIETKKHEACADYTTKADCPTVLESNRKCVWGNGACYQAPTLHPACLPAMSSGADEGYLDAFRGWYDLQGCGQCNDYCRWTGASGSGGDPTWQGHGTPTLTHNWSSWTCRRAGKTQVHSSMSHLTSWRLMKCEYAGAAAPPLIPAATPYQPGDRKSVV